MRRQPPRSTLFPYPTLFRSQPLAGGAAVKVSTSLRRRDGTGTDRLTGREQDDIDSRNFRTQALFRPASNLGRSEEHTSELQSRQYLVCRLLLAKKKHTLPNM